MGEITPQENPADPVRPTPTVVEIRRCACGKLMIEVYWLTRTEGDTEMRISLWWCGCGRTELTVVADEECRKRWEQANSNEVKALWPPE